MTPSAGLCRTNWPLQDGRRNATCGRPRRPETCDTTNSVTTKRDDTTCVTLGQLLNQSGLI